MTEAKSDRKKSANQRSSTKTASAKSAKDAPGKASAAKKTSKTTEAPSAVRTTKETAASPPAARTQVIDEQPKLPTSHGKITIFGGPKDRGIKPDDKLALPTGPHGVYERVRNLNPRTFYCSMRWNYHVQHMTPEEVKRWWANKKLLLTNANAGKAVVVRAVDYGPHENTGLDIGISPGAAEALGVEIGDEVDISLADPKAPLGPTE
jgi:hypothetical protein